VELHVKRLTDEEREASEDLIRRSLWAQVGRQDQDRLLTIADIWKRIQKLRWFVSRIEIGDECLVIVRMRWPWRLLGLRRWIDRRVRRLIGDRIPLCVRIEVR
jgi:hypothetical protein